MIAVRCQGLALDSIIGIAYSQVCAGQDAGPISLPVVSEAYLEMLVNIANDRFERNAQRITRFQQSINGLRHLPAVGSNSDAREDAETRRMRKRAEGLQRQAALRGSSDVTSDQPAVDHSLDAPLDASIDSG